MKTNNKNKICKLLFYQDKLTNNKNLDIITFMLATILKIDLNILKNKIKLISNPLSNTILTNLDLEKEILISISQDENYLLIEVLINKKFYQKNKLYDSFIENKIFENNDYNYSIKFLTGTKLRKIIQEKFYLDKKGNLLTKKYRSININLDKCYKIFLNNNYQDFNYHLKNLIFLSSILITTNYQETITIIKLLKAPINIKRKLKQVNKEYFKI